MQKFFKYLGDSVSMGIIVDFSSNSETYFIGDPDKIREYAHVNMTLALSQFVMKHSGDFGNLLKDCNRLMRVKREINELIELSERLCDVDSFCNGNYNSVLEELAGYYDFNEYANVMKNYIICLLYCNFKKQREMFNKKVGLSVKNNHDRAIKHIDDYKNFADRIFKPFLTAREKLEFVIDGNLFALENVTEHTVYHIRTKEKPITFFVADNSYIALLELYDDLLSRANKIIRNCENCGELMITNRANASLVCTRRICKRDYHTKTNSESRRRAMKEPIQSAYIVFNDKCKTYRKKLLPFPDLLEKFDEKHNLYRERLKKAKLGLTKSSRSADIEHFEMLCSDAALDMQELAKMMKKQSENGNEM